MNIEQRVGKCWQSVNNNKPIPRVQIIESLMRTRRNQTNLIFLPVTDQMRDVNKMSWRHNKCYMYDVAELWVTACIHNMYIVLIDVTKINHIIFQSISRSHPQKNITVRPKNKYRTSKNWLYFLLVFCIWILRQ